MAQDKDKQLDDYLAGKDPLSSNYARTDKMEPSAGVDKAILDAAHHSVGRKGKGISPFSGSWFMPAALAAVLVLTVGIFITLEDEVGTDLYEADRYRQNEYRRAPDLPEDTPSEPSLKDSDKRQRQTEIPGSKSAAKPQPAKKAKSRLQVEEKESQFLQKQQTPKLLLEEAGVLEPEPDSAPASKPAPSAADPFVPYTAPAEVQPAPMQTNDEAAPAPMKREVLQENAADSEKPLAAKEWLKKILMLKEKGDLETAREEARKFKETYPEYELSDELNTLFR